MGNFPFTINKVDSNLELTLMTQELSANMVATVLALNNKTWQMENVFSHQRTHPC